MFRSDILMLSSVQRWWTVLSLVCRGRRWTLRCRQRR